MESHHKGVNTSVYQTSSLSLWFQVSTVQILKQEEEEEKRRIRGGGEEVEERRWRKRSKKEVERQRLKRRRKREAIEWSGPSMRACILKC